MTTVSDRTPERSESWVRLAKHVRQASHWTEEELAAWLGTDQTTVSRAERRLTTPRGTHGRALKACARGAGLVTRDEVSSVEPLLLGW